MGFFTQLELCEWHHQCKKWLANSNDSKRNHFEWSSIPETDSCY